MKTRRSLVTAALAASALALAACSQSPPPAPKVEVVEMPGEQAQEFARLLAQFDPVGFGNLLTENARFLPPNQPAIEGRQAIVEHYKGSVDNALGFEVAPQTRVMLGNVGIAEGSYKVRNTQTGEYIEDGKFMTVWVNQDGQWKLARLMTNTDYKIATPAVEVGTPAP
ncbi:MAG: nuclear transport factor 2 family protein [Steroidobacteraceae bacterium]|nr:nuclear transport factor 2 family protein [Steroidobacteraceae bacterium]